MYADHTLAQVTEFDVPEWLDEDGSNRGRGRSNAADTHTEADSIHADVGGTTCVTRCDHLLDSGWYLHFTTLTPTILQMH